VRDLRSKNGTYVGGVGVSGPVTVIPGAEIRIGGTVLKLRSLPESHGFDRMIGKTSALSKAIALAKRAAASDCNIVILGETGTGKDVMARAIHECSAVAPGPYVAINCGAIPRELVAAELFGHVRGAFTGATSDRDGVFVQANGGTLFLDELGELPLAQQPHLLRVLETGSVKPVGSHHEKRYCARIIAATNALDLKGPDSPFRQDLYHRLATVVLELPPLRERRDDIPLLVRHFMLGLEARYGRRTIADATLSELAGLSWPGNVRELRQAVHRATALCSTILELDTLVPPRVREESPGYGGGMDAELIPTERAVRDLLLGAYQRYGSIRRAAASLGMAKSTFADRAHRFGILPARVER